MGKDRRKIEMLDFVSGDIGQKENVINILRYRQFGV